MYVHVWVCLGALHAAYSKCNEVQQIQQNLGKKTILDTFVASGSARLKDTWRGKYIEQMLWKFSYVY